MTKVVISPRYFLVAYKKSEVDGKWYIEQDYDLALGVRLAVPKSGPMMKKAE